MNQHDAPLITTVVPTYRRPHLVGRALRSVLEQTFPRVRALVCDNASGDDTAAVVRRIAERDDRVEYHAHPANIGSYNNFNFGINSVRTPFFSLLSDDDMLAPDFYRQAMAAFEAHPDAMFVCVATIVIDEQGRVISPPIAVPQPRYFAAGEGFEAIATLQVPNTWTGIVFRAEVRDRIGLIDVDAGPFVDGSYVCHAAARFAFVVMPGIAAALVAHPASTSGTTGTLDRRWLEWDERMIATIERDPEISAAAREHVRRLFKRDYRKIALLQIGHALSEDDVESARRTAIGLSDCGYPLTSLLLRLGIEICRWIWPARIALQWLKHARRQRVERERDEINQDCKDQAAFVEPLLRIDRP